MSSSASQRDLYGITADELNKFVQTEVEPDTEYISGCNAVVDRLSNFIKNNFPGDLKPSNVLKVSSLSYVIQFNKSLNLVYVCLDGQAE